ncbi:hypothetical protein [Actinomadura violacea]|uniref:YbaB/EbfC DNA-binding family protein n=1 Tax=Actinomadura violacea TaxID=2819934 RepID=A0ABS3S8A3_9ACTN|nr:hypothetical protein [Actinomadura violacea]MBO2464988.1 hypothetical protein [Actinomadura violacea]
MTGGHQDQGLPGEEPDPLRMARNSLAALRRLSEPIRAAHQAGAEERAADLRLQAIVNGTGRKQAVLLDDAARYALVSIAQDIRAIRAAVPQIQDVLPALASALAEAAKDLGRTTGPETSPDSGGEPAP